MYEIHADDQPVTGRIWSTLLENHNSTLIQLTLTQKRFPAADVSPDDDSTVKGTPVDNYLAGPISHRTDPAARNPSELALGKATVSSDGKAVAPSQPLGRDSNMASNSRQTRRPFTYSSTVHRTPGPARRPHTLPRYPTFTSPEYPSNALVPVTKETSVKFGIERRTTGNLEIQKPRPALAWTPKEKPIKFRDVNGIELPIPYRLCKKWDVRVNSLKI